MKKNIILLLLTSLFLLSGCAFEDKIKREYDRIKHQYEEYRGEKDDRGERPFTVVFQQDENAKTALITSECAYNDPVKSVYYMVPSAAHANYFNDTKNLISYPGSGKALKPFWDMRYVNEAKTYINGGTHREYADHSVRTGLDARSGTRNTATGTHAAPTDPGAGVVQSKCVNGLLTAGTTISLWDAPEQALTYAGPQSTFVYRLGSTSRTSPWKGGGTGNLMMQASFDTPLYNNFAENIGGGIYFGFFMKNKRTGKFLNYVIGLYAVGEAWRKEKAGIRFDPTTNIVHVATVIKDDSWWCTKSPKSKAIEEIYNVPDKKTKDDNKWNNFFRVNISYQNLLAVLQELKKAPPPEAAGVDFGLSPEDWELTTIMIQYELEESGGKAIFSGSFRDFGAYISQLPL
jgi:major membrane immunogen (membrane-anchored lipoprotein)